MSSEGSSDSDEFDVGFVSNAGKKTQKQIKKATSQISLQSPIRQRLEKVSTKPSNKDEIVEIIKVVPASPAAQNAKMISEGNNSVASVKKPLASNSWNEGLRECREEMVSVTPPPSLPVSRNNSSNGEENQAKKSRTQVNSKLKPTQKTKKALDKLEKHKNWTDQDNIPDDEDTMNNASDCLENSQEITPRRHGVNMKIRWKHQVFRVELSPYDLLGKLFDLFAEKVQESPDALMFRLNQKVMLRTDTYRSLNVNIADIVVAEYKVHDIGLEENLITIKIQSSNVNSRSASKMIRIRRTDPMRLLMKNYAEKTGANWSHLTFKFEGYNVADSETPESLGLEDEDCIDVYDTRKKKEAEASGGKSAKNDDRQEETNTPPVKMMIVIDDSMFSD